MAHAADALHAIELVPDDEHNRELVQHAHPQDWQNPTPTGRYNLVAIGGGTAGIIAALGAAGLGGKAALVEDRLLGGDCLNFGCVPSKALLMAARAAHHVADASRFGLAVDGPLRVDFAAVMERLRRLRAQISHHDSAQRFSSMGVDVYLGRARFVAPDAIEVDGRTLRFHRAVVATGGRAAVPAIEGLEEAGYLTNETVFSLTERPRRLVVLGAGPVGCELAQAFRRFGSDVHVVARRETLLPKEDPAASRIVARQFEREGVWLHLGWTPIAADRTGGARGVVLARHGNRKKILADAILVAAGRAANVENLGLDAAGIRHSSRGIEVDDFLRTTNRAVYAAGDCAETPYQFTHAADAMARICVQNALFAGRKRLSRLVIPRATYTDPEVAHVGLTPHEAAERSIEIDSYRVDLAEVDRAVLDGDDDGFAVVHTRRGGGRIVGATIVAGAAGDLLAEVTLAMTARLSLSHIASTIHAYPTQGEVLKRIADRYQRTRLTPAVHRLFSRWLAWRRGEARKK